MQGVTAAIVAFVFLALAIPSLIKEKKQYYGGVIAVMVIIFFDALGHMVDAGGFRIFTYVVAAMFQIIAIFLLILATGGMTFRQLKGDIIEVVRRGETQAEIIIPLSDEAKRKRTEAQARPREDELPKTYTIDDPAPPAAQRPPAQPPPSTGPLPLE